MINSYPKIWNLGHPHLTELLSDDVLIEEKVDGSQFSMCRKGGVLLCRSKGAELNIDEPEKMFSIAIEIAKSLDLVDGWVYRGEYLRSPKHNTLSYHRTPKNHIAIFDICTGVETYLEPALKAIEADRLGLEVVPHIYSGRVETAGQLAVLLDRDSFLGGAKIEGIVIKNYKRFGNDGKVLLGKHVSEDFKEVHRHEWKKTSPKNNDVLAVLAANYRTSPRWAKAVQRLRDAGKLQNAPQDIGPLLREIHTDLDEECRAEIAEHLLRWAMPHVKRAVARGFPEWYKERLLEQQFIGDEP